MERKKKKYQLKANEVNPESINNRPKLFIEYSPEEIHQALTKNGEFTDPVTEMICNSQATFDMIRHSELAMNLKKAFRQLEQVHHFYTNLIWKSRSL